MKMPVENIQNEESKEVELDAQGKFNQMFKKLNNELRFPNNSYIDDDNQKITLNTSYYPHVPNSPQIVIQKETKSEEWEISISKYILTKFPDDTFSLETQSTDSDGNLDQKQYIPKLTESELKTDVLPNFENRINWLNKYHDAQEKFKEAKRQSDIKTAAQYAHMQGNADQNDAWAEVEVSMDAFLADPNNFTWVW